MSISGDTVIMRNGRTTSQVSIYNYPEHLNPFYEEDQHKRLRFWKVNKHADNDRWKSISITSLKDLWPLKSFRLSKKKSSTLGVNKTSESPPILRRDLADYNYTPNRVSLQNDPYSKRATSMGFDRNDQYRSTIQVMGGNQSMPRYNYERSVTPQPQRSNFMETPILNRRSGSRTSTTSTNPFEDFDDEEDVENYFHRGPMQTQSLMPTQRKKRRAPIPTALLNNHKSSESSSQLNNNTNTTTTNTTKTDESVEIDESLNISNLASQIQDFVDTLDKRDEEEEKATSALAQKQLMTTPTKTNGTITPLAQSTPKNIVVREKSTEKEPVTTIKTTTTTLTNVEVKEKTSIPEIKVEAKEIKEEVKVTEKIKPKMELEQEINLDINKKETTKIEKQLNLDTKNKETTQTTENNINIEQSRKNVTLKTPFILTTPPTPTPTPSPQINEEPPLREIVIFGALTGPEKPKRSSLNKRTVEFLEQEQIREQQLQWNKELQQQKEEEQAYLASRNFSKIPDNEQQLKKQQKEQLVTQMYTSTTTTSNVNYVNGESTGAIPRTREWKDSSLAPLQSSVPPEKRKSAKEIIESINRQQRLLKEAAERNMPDTKNSNGRLQGVIIYNHFQQTAINSNDLDNTQKQKIKNKREEGASSSNAEFRDPQKQENGSPVFAKCRVFKENYPQRESSPTTSNLDWNPLPKPKRNKDISLD